MAQQSLETVSGQTQSVRSFLVHALSATAMVVLTPLWVVIFLLAVISPTLPMAALAAVGVLTALGTIVGGTALWMRSADAAFIPFSDLMLPRYLARRRAELQVTEGTRLLGLDPAGRPVGQVRVSPAEQLQVLKHLTGALEAKDPYTHGHSQRVERHAYRTAAALGFSPEQLEDIRKAAALHDVGKIRVPDRILRKDAQLTEDERRTMEDHAIVGAWMVSGVGNPDVIAGVKHHHEHWDGTGYPDGLTGSQIPLFARVIAVADTYDALNSTRPYRASCGRAAAVEILRREAGRQLDPHVVACFVSSLPTRLPVAAGLLVAFSSPHRLLRELLSWLKRFGAGNLAPALGAAGAVAVLGASMFSSGLPTAPHPDGTVAVATMDRSLGGISLREADSQARRPRGDGGRDPAAARLIGRVGRADAPVAFSRAGTSGGGSSVDPATPRVTPGDDAEESPPRAEPGGSGTGAPVGEGDAGSEGEEEPTGEGSEGRSEPKGDPGPEEGREEEEEEEEDEEEVEAAESDEEDHSGSGRTGSGGTGGHSGSGSGHSGD